MTNPYRAPEMDPHIPISDLPPRDPARIDDDVIRQPWTMAALLIAVALIIGIGLLVLGETYGPSRVVQSQAPMTQPNVRERKVTSPARAGLFAVETTKSENLPSSPSRPS
jgi:hypothetical protein